MRALRAVLWFLILLTSLSAVLIAAFEIASHEDAPGWLATKLSACAATIAAGALIALAIAIEARDALRAAARAAAALLILLGVTGIAHTLHLARVTGDLEAWVIAIQVAMIAQGALAIVALAPPGWRRW